MKHHKSVLHMEISLNHSACDNNVFDSEGVALKLKINSDYVTLMSSQFSSLVQHFNLGLSDLWWETAAECYEK